MKWRTVALVGAGLVAGAAGWLVFQPSFGRRRRRGVPAPSPELLEASVRAFAETFHPRDHLHVENLDAAAAFVEKVFRDSGARTSGQEWVVDGRTYRNVIGSFGPESGERIIVGAHYDACAELGEPTPGADDNASGVAGLLALAPFLEAARPSTRIDLVAYSLEEPPFYETEKMGSAHHARKLFASAVRVRAMISLEMIGYFTDAPGSQRYSLPALGPILPSKGDFVAVIGRLGDGGLARRVKASMRGASDLRVVSLNAPPSLGHVDYSDHRSYWDLGYPAVMVTDTADFRNPNYHKLTDLPETLDYERMAEVLRGVLAAILDISGD